MCIRAARLSNIDELYTFPTSQEEINIRFYNHVNSILGHLTSGEHLAREQNDKVEEKAKQDKSNANKKKRLIKKSRRKRPTNRH